MDINMLPTARNPVPDENTLYNLLKRYRQGDYERLSVCNAIAIAKRILETSEFPRIYLSRQVSGFRIWTAVDKDTVNQYNMAGYGPVFALDMNALELACAAMDIATLLGPAASINVHGEWVVYSELLIARLALIEKALTLPESEVMSYWLRANTQHALDVKNLIPK